MNILQKSMSRFIIGMSNRNVLNWVPDKTYLKMLFWARMGKKLDLKHPRTFNEILQWLKLYDRKPIYTKMVDKYEVKQYVTEKLGEEYVIPILGIWDHFDDIDFDKLPDQFVLKCTHDSAGLVICRDKSALNILEAKRKIEKSLHKNYYWHAREWPYKNVKPRILAEKYIHDDERKTDENLIVYKIFNFEGVPTIIQVITNDKCKDESIDYFDTQWNLLQLHQNFPNSKIHLERPRKLEKILELSAFLSKGFHFLRVDFYEVQDKILFSEFTFYTDAGFERYYPDEWDYKFGSLIRLD